MARTVTIRDVAERAGVSRQTVSRAINNKGEIEAATRQRILEVARELGYRPNRLARGLKTNRTFTLGLVVPDIANPFFAEVVRGASEVADRAGYGVLLCNTDERPEREWAILRLLEAQRVDGLILVSSRLSEALLNEAIATWPPIVLVNRWAQARPGLGCVLVNDALGAMVAVEHLLARGHRRIGFVAGAPESHSGQERRRGYYQAMRTAGLAVPEGWCVPCAPTVEGGREAVLQLLRAHPDLTALLAYNDLVALGAQQAARELGRAVRQELALVGWDDIVFAAHVSPPLTTLRMPKQQLGRRAMELLLALLGDPSLSPSPVVLEAELVVREST